MRPYQLRAIHDTLSKLDTALRNALRLGIFLALCTGPYIILRSAGEPSLDLFILVMGLLVILAAVTPYCALCHMALQEWYSLPRRASGFLATCAVGYGIFLVLTGELMKLSVGNVTVFGFSVLLPTVSAASIYTRARIAEEHPEWAVRGE